MRYELDVRVMGSSCATLSTNIVYGRLGRNIVRHNTFATMA